MEKENIKIGIGTKNPVKIQAIKDAFSKIWPTKSIEFISENIKSNVRDQPLSDQEGIDGAVNRAEGVFRLHPNLDFSVGLEGTINESEYGMMLYGWVIIIDSKGNLGMSSTTQFMLPEIVAERIRHGEELGPIMDDLTNQKNIKHKNGTSGILTNNLLDRKSEFENSVIAAMSRFIVPKMYER